MRLSRFSGLAAMILIGCGGPASEDNGSADEVGESGSGDSGSGESGESSSGESSESESSEVGGEVGDLDLPNPPPLDPMVVMTFNVLCSFCDDTYDPWLDRIAYIADTITRHSPDLVGLQELFTAEEVQQLLDLSPGYSALFYSDDTSDYADATIWYRSDRYAVVDSGFYWLSPAPDLPFSVGFAQPQFPRLVAWAQLRELSTDAELLFVDTHFDNNSPSQELSAPLLLERTEAQAGTLPIVVVGDFNSRPDSTAYAILDQGVEGSGFSLTNSFDLAGEWSVESNLDPAPDYDPSERIDHVWVAGGTWTVPSWVVDTWVYGPDQKHTSDHFAITTQLQFEG
ncbi:endonuclease/exonuclease/phosphatase family protein [Nannocystaceae bacterium ST9]